MKAKTPLQTLQELVKRHGGQSAAAKELGLNRQLISDLIARRRDFSAAVAKRLGYRKRVVFESIGSKK